MNLTTTYLGFTLPHPFIPGASPLADNLDTVRRMEDSGAPMIMLRSLFEEQIVGEQLATYHAAETMANVFGEATSFLADPPDAVFGPEQYLEHIRKIRSAVRVPVVASLNGRTRGGWLDYAKLIEQAGANALELNVYDIATDGERSAADIEQETIHMVREIKGAIALPLAVKLSPFYTSFANFARQLDEAGADAIVIFNRFYQTDIDIEELEPVTALHLSDSSEVLLRLRWLAILFDRIRADLAVTGGVHDAIGAVKALMCGATTVQMVSALLQRGPRHLFKVAASVSEWMDEHGYESLEQLRGSMSLKNCPDPSAFERANYMQTLYSWRDERP
ncbi:MAG: dihydroorotate dehydrogenase-like protein [Phycisphaerales bacterium]|nr:dihydroorotate dehydrogenase-like protein [Phycisphaerales bacterium]